jgi:hypothetical protein
VANALAALPQASDSDTATQGEVSGSTQGNGTPAGNGIVTPPAGGERLSSKGFGISPSFNKRSSTSGQHDEASMLEHIQAQARQHDKQIVQHVGNMRRRATLQRPEAPPAPAEGAASSPIGGGSGSGFASNRRRLATSSPRFGQQAGARATIGAACQPGASPGGIRRGSIVIGNKAAISPQEYLEHVDAIRTAWRYAAAQTIHDIRLAKRMKKQKKYGHFSIEHWGRTSRVFEKFFWFHSHYFIQYFLQGAVFCTSIYFAIVMNFGEQHIFSQFNFEHKLPQVVLLVTTMVVIVLLGLFTLVPAILMQYTMVMHLAQLHETDIVNDAVAAAKHVKSHEEQEREHRWSYDRLVASLTCEKFEAWANSTVLMYFFLTLLLVDFFISVLASVVRQDQADFCVEH